MIECPKKAGYVAKLEEALVFYANCESYKSPHIHTHRCGRRCPEDDRPLIVLDAGTKARLALGDSE